MSQTKPIDAVKMQDLDTFFDQLLAETFTIDYEGRTFTFKKRYPSAILQKVVNLNKIAQMNYLISYLAQDPKIPQTKVGKIPAAMLNLVGLEIKKYNQDVISGEAPKTSPVVNP